MQGTRRTEDELQLHLQCRQRLANPVHPSRHHLLRTQESQRRGQHGEVRGALLPAEFAAESVNQNSETGTRREALCGAGTPARENRQPVPNGPTADHVHSSHTSANRLWCNWDSEVADKSVRATRSMFPTRRLPHPCHVLCDRVGIVISS